MPARAWAEVQLRTTQTGSEMVYVRTHAGRVLKTRLPHSIVKWFMERLGEGYTVSRTGKTFYFGGSETEQYALYRATVFLAVASCTRRPDRRTAAAEAALRLPYSHARFWFTQVYELYRGLGARGLCRVARAFKALYAV